MEELTDDERLIVLEALKRHLPYEKGVANTILNRVIKKLESKDSNETSWSFKF